MPLSEIALQYRQRNFINLENQKQTYYRLIDVLNSLDTTVPKSHRKYLKQQIKSQKCLIKAIKQELASEDSKQWLDDRVQELREDYTEQGTDREMDGENDCVQSEQEEVVSDFHSDA